MPKTKPARSFAVRAIFLEDFTSTDTILMSRICTSRTETTLVLELPTIDYYILKHG